MCGTYQPTNVISISYGDAEDYIPQSYYERQCNEFVHLYPCYRTFKLTLTDS
jgi:tripeptidyl-peptidase-1